MTLKEMRGMLAEQMKMVREDKCHIPQAESIANLAGKTIKTIQLEIQAEMMQKRGDSLRVFEDILKG